MSTVDANGHRTETPVRLPGSLLDATSDESSLRRFLFGLPGVDYEAEADPVQAMPSAG